jgi:hypothetical protein
MLDMDKHELQGLLDGSNQRGFFQRVMSTNENDSNVVDVVQEVRVVTIGD